MSQNSTLPTTPTHAQEHVPPEATLVSSPEQHLPLVQAAHQS